MLVYSSVIKNNIKRYSELKQLIKKAEKTSEFEKVKEYKRELNRIRPLFFIA